MWVDMVRVVVWVVIVCQQDSIEEEENEVDEVEPNTETIVKVALVADVISAVVDNVNPPIQPTYEEKIYADTPYTLHKAKWKDCILSACS